MNLEFMVDYFDQFIGLSNQEQNPENVKKLCAYFGHPEFEIPCLHVTGSKGKGSITTMAGNILKSSGFKTVGLFRSPALTHFTDRISEVDGPFDPKVYQKALKVFQSGLEHFKNLNLTYFEAITVFSFLVFREAKCDFAVYEVFAGGYHDPTNIINPEVAIINTIELEHTELLGDTPEKIATEKSGIIKKGVSVVVGPQPKDSIKKIFLKKAKAVEAKEIIFIQKDLQTSYFLDDENYLKMRIENLNPPKSLGVDLRLVGDFQAENAKVAATAVGLVVKNLTDQAIKTGLEKSFIPGRFEIKTNAELINFPSIPYLIMDGAHTKNSAKGAAATLEIYRQLLAKQRTYDSCLTDFALNKSPILLFACAKNKKVEEMAAILRPHFSEIILTKPGDFKAADLPRAKKSFYGATVIEDYKSAIETAFKKANKEGRGLVALGSLYLVAEAKKYLEHTTALPW